MDELNQILEVDPDWLPEPDQIFNPAAIVAFQKSSAAYNEIKEQAKVYWDAAADNHFSG